MRGVTVSAPGRVCLFGDHMDWMGSQVITGAIDRRIHLRARLNDSEVCVVESYPPFTRREEYPVGDPVICEGSDLRYLGAVVRVLGGRIRLEGADIELFKPDPPQGGVLEAGKGLSSSAALCVSSAAALSALHGGFPTAGADDASALAEVAYAAEHDVLGINCGRMDPYACSLGGVLHIDCEPTRFGCEELRPMRGVDLVIGDTGKKKDTPMILGWLKKRRDAGESELAEGVRRITGVVARARRVLSEPDVDYQLLGRLMDENQESIRDHLQVSGGCPVSPSSLDDLIASAKGVGALGAKVTGSGGGGCMIALSPPGRTEAVCSAIADAGGRPEVARISGSGVQCLPLG